MAEKVFVTAKSAHVPCVHAQLGDDWQCYGENVSFADTPETLAGKSSIPVRLDEENKIRFTDLFPFSGVIKTTAILRGKIRVEESGFVLFGCGADYWVKICCCGKMLFTTEPLGNAGGPCSVWNKVFQAELPVGEHEIFFYVGSGSGGWSGAIAALPPTAENAALVDHFAEIQSLYPPEPRITHGPWVSHLMQHNASIRFTTNGCVASALEICEAGSGKFRRHYRSQNGHLIRDSYRHTFQLQDLQPGTEYEYRLVLQDPVSGAEVPHHGLFRFRTMPEKTEEFSFTSLGDTHVVGKCKYALFEAFEKVPDFRNAKFFVHLGDMSGNFEHFDYEILDGMMDYFSSRQIPFLPIHGNHEYCGLEGCFWNHYFAWPDGNSFGMIRAGNTAILAVDFMNHLPDEPREKFEPRTFDYCPDGTSDRQRDWLKKVFASPEFTTAKFRIVLTHGPDFRHSETFPTTAKFMKEFLPGQKIHLFLCGHIHHYMRVNGPAGIFYTRTEEDRGVRPETVYPFPIVSLDGGENVNEFCCGTVRITEDKLSFTARNAGNEVIDRFDVDENGVVSGENTAGLVKHRL